MSTRGDLPYTVTLHVRDTCLCLHLQRSARVVARRFDDALRPLDLTNGQFSLLMSLNRPVAARSIAQYLLSSHYGPLKNEAVSAWEVHSPSTW